MPCSACKAELCKPTEKWYVRLPSFDNVMLAVELMFFVFHSTFPMTLDIRISMCTSFSWTASRILACFRDDLFVIAAIRRVTAGDDRMRVGRFSSTEEKDDEREHDCTRSSERWESLRSVGYRIRTVLSIFVRWPRVEYCWIIHYWFDRVATNVSERCWWRPIERSRREHCEFAPVPNEYRQRIAFSSRQKMDGRHSVWSLSYAKKNSIHPMSEPSPLPRGCYRSEIRVTHR